MILHIEVDSNGILETYTLGKYASLCDVSVMQRVGGSVSICSVCVDYSSETNEDFLPLTVQYLERYYSIGRIPQGFTRREGKPTDHEVLVSRLVDRSLRSLFRSDFFHNVHVTILVMSYDGVSDLTRDCLNLASISLQLSSIPLKSDRFLCASRVMRVGGEALVCRDYSRLSESSVDLFVSGFDAGISMIEMKSLKTVVDGVECSNDICTDDLISLLALARDDISSLSVQYEELFTPHKKKKFDLRAQGRLDTELLSSIDEKYSDRIDSLLRVMSQTENVDSIKKLQVDIELDFCKDFLSIVGADGAAATMHSLSKSYLLYLCKSRMRDNALRHIRADKRKIDEIRHIDIETGILPNVHGSACFTRGHTQALVSCTLGSDVDAQTNESLQSSKKRRLIFHYNFLPFSVNEASPVLSVSRREVGHGNLALVAVQSNIANNDHVIRIVSEILQSNGSSSMASVCGASLALKNANVGMHNLVAGISIGLVYKDENNFVALSDINGLEDFFGDADLKLAGSRKGFTAMQLDIKIDSLSLDLIKHLLHRGEQGLSCVLDAMEKVSVAPNFNILPRREVFSLRNNKASDLIGRGGKTIKEITQTFNVTIDIDKVSNEVVISSSSRQNIIRAKEYIFDQVFRNSRGR